MCPRLIALSFHRTGSILVLHHETGIAGTGWSSGAVYRDKHRQRCHDGLYTAVNVAADCSLPVLNLKDFLGVSNLVESQFLCDLRPHLCRVSVDRLTTTDDNVYIADFLHGRSQCVGCSQRVSTCKLAVGQQPAGIGAAIEPLPDNLAGTWRPHGQYPHGSPRVLFLQPERLLQCVQVFRVEDGRQCGTVHRSLGCHGILPHVSCVRYLLGKYNDFQTHKYNNVLFRNSVTCLMAKVLFFCKTNK